MIVSLRDLTIRYGAFTAVDRVSVELPAGAVGLLGRNGAGKTSILKALLGLVRPTSGRLTVLDLPAGVGATDLRRRVGYMPEKDCHIQGLNGFETVALAGRLSGLPALDASRRAHEVLYLVGLDEQRYRPVSGYSTGMRQKVKLGTALVHDPEILFLDEPTNGLDPRGRVEMLAIIESLSTELGKSVVLSSHILQDVERVCKSVVLLEKGKVLDSGPLSALTASPVRSYVLVADGDLERVRTGLQRAGVGAITPDADGAMHLEVPDSLSPRELFAAVHAAGGAVRALREHRRTLEEVFLGAVDEAGRVELLEGRTA